MSLLLIKWNYECEFVNEVEGLHGNSRVRGVNLGGWLVIEGWIKPTLFDDIPNGDMLVSVCFFFLCVCVCMC